MTGEIIMKHPPNHIKSNIINWLEAIWCADLPSSSKLLAAYLRSFMNEKQNMAYPSISRIVYETGLSRNTVTRHIKLLESEGWLSVDHSIGGSGKCNQYIAILPERAYVLIANRFNKPPHHGTVQPWNGSTIDKNPSMVDKNPPTSELEYTKNIQRINNSVSFDFFWSVYPRLTAKDKARLAWKKLNPNDGLVTEITLNIEQRLKSGDWSLDRKNYIPHASTYLNGKRWEDEIIIKVESNGQYQTANEKAAELARATTDYDRATDF